MHIPTGAWKIWIIIKMFYEFWWITYCYIKIKMLPIRSNDSCCWYGNMRIISFTNSWRDHVQYFTLYNLPFFKMVTLNDLIIFGQEIMSIHHHHISKLEKYWNWNIIRLKTAADEITWCSTLRYQLPFFEFDIVYIIPA